jgi:hypothetical protein
MPLSTIFNIIGDYGNYSTLSYNVNTACAKPVLNTTS